MAKKGEERDALAAELDLLRQREREAADAAKLTDVDDALIAYLSLLREMIAGRVMNADGTDAIRAALLSVFESFTLRPLWTQDGPEWVHLDLSVGDYAVRPEAIDRIARTVGDTEVQYEVPRRIPLVKPVNGSYEGLPLESLFGPILVTRTGLRV